jgi:hypothetical protein
MSSLSFKVLKNPIIVTGMHRSGTSMVTRILKQSGVYDGAYRDANDESWLFMALNRILMKKCGLDWDTVVAPGQFALSESQTERLADFAHRTLRSPLKYLYLGLRSLRWESIKTPWCWKDPRNSITLPIWLKIFPEAIVVNVIRHGVDVAESMRVRELWLQERFQGRHGMRAGGIFTQWHGRHGGISQVANIHYGMRLWDTYNECLKENLSPIPEERSITVRYEDYLTTPRVVQDRILSVCGLEEVEEIKISPDSKRAFAYRRKAQLREIADEYESMLSKWGY